MVRKSLRVDRSGARFRREAVPWRRHYEEGRDCPVEIATDRTDLVHPLRRVFLVAALCVLPAAASAAERHGYVASNDGKGHWLHVLPDRLEVRSPVGALSAGDDGIVPLMLELSCRDGEAPVRAILSFPRHRDEPRAERFFDNPIRSLWLGLVGDEPVYREDVRITVGGSTFPATVVRNLSSYDIETDYQALLPPTETVREILASTGGSLTIEVKGTRIGGRASYTITAEFAERTETMRRNCGT